MQDLTDMMREEMISASALFQVLFCAGSPLATALPQRQFQTQFQVWWFIEIFSAQIFSSPGLWLRHWTASRAAPDSAAKQRQWRQLWSRTVAGEDRDHDSRGYSETDQRVSVQHLHLPGKFVCEQCAILNCTMFAEQTCLHTFCQIIMTPLHKDDI